MVAGLVPGGAGGFWRVAEWHGAVVGGLERFRRVWGMNPVGRLEICWRLRSGGGCVRLAVSVSWVTGLASFSHFPSF